MDAQCGVKPVPSVRAVGTHGWKVATGALHEVVKLSGCKHEGFVKLVEIQPASEMTVSLEGSNLWSPLWTTRSCCHAISHWLSVQRLPFVIRPELFVQMLYTANILYCVDSVFSHPVRFYHFDHLLLFLLTQDVSVSSLPSRISHSSVGNIFYQVYCNDMQQEIELHPIEKNFLLYDSFDFE